MVFQYGVILFLLLASSQGEKCDQREAEYGSICVCDSAHCDTVPEIDVSDGKYQIYTTSAEKMGFSAITGPLEKIDDDFKGFKVDLRGATPMQKILGFGGAFTDSAGLNIKTLPEEAQRKLMESYYGKNGNQYSMGRVPIGGTDFSTRQYTYDDVDGEDLELEHFALAEEDFEYKIPFIQEAIELTNNSINLFASSWQAPIWMKNPNSYHITYDYFQVWANYFVKFFEEYKKNGIEFWGMTTQNQPLAGLLPNFLIKLDFLGYTPSLMRTWISKYLGPTIRNSSFSNLKVMAHDDQRISLFASKSVWEDDESVKYIDGIGVHWYSDFIAPKAMLKDAKSSKKDLFLLGTEACAGSFGTPVRLGSWLRGEMYFKDIMDDLEYGAGGWVDWNLVLDLEGGPSRIKHYADAPVKVNSTSGEFYKQPMFYAMGHFSKFFRPDSEVVHVQNPVFGKVKSVAAKRPDGLTAVIVYNEETKPIDVEIILTDNSVVKTEIQAKSWNTVLFKM